MTSKLGWAALKEWTAQAEGHETIGVGMRPYGLHAGNLASVVASPYLLFENFEETLRKTPRFRFQIWFNDIEPVTYVGADGTRQSADDANMYPGSTTFQFTPAPEGNPGSVVDYWQAAVEHIVRKTIGERFPDVVLEFRRASELVVTPEFEKTVVGCIRKANDVKFTIDRWNLSRGYAPSVTHVRGASSFVWPLSPEHNEPLLSPELEKTFPGGNLISAAHPDDTHASIIRTPIVELSWAVQFRMLQAARLAAIQPDLWVMGMDHRPTNMGGVMQDLAGIFGIDEFRGSFLHIPLLFAEGAKKLSKSLGNAAYIPFDDLVAVLRNNPNPGIDMRSAPVSSDMMNIGHDLLPAHMISNEPQRLAALEQQMKAYEASGRRKNFQSANRKGRISNRKVANMVGTPHL